MEHLSGEPDRRRFLGRLVREVARSELAAIEHAARESRRIGEAAPPAAALRAIAAHAASMQPRLAALVAGYEVPSARGGLGAALASLRDLVVDRLVQAERAYRIALLDLRQGVDVVKLLRDATRRDQLLGIIRWCDDWLSVRRVLVAHAERELAWFSTSPAHTDQPSGPGTRADEPPSSEDRPTSHDRR